MLVFLQWYVGIEYFHDTSVLKVITNENKC